jgi:AsmA family protein
MSILRVLKWLGVTFILLVAAVVLYLSFADLDWLRPRIEAAANDATGRQLRLEGPLDIGIVPSPALLIENVSLSNADWGSEPAMVRIGHLSARLGVWSLVFGPVRVEELRLRDVDVLLETNSQGEGNWDIGAPPESEPAGQSETQSQGDVSVPVIIQFAELRNIKLRYRAPETEPFVATLAALDVTTDADGYTVLSGKGEIDKLPLTLAGKLGQEQALASGENIDIHLNAALGSLALDVDGNIADLAQATGVDIKTVVSSDDIAKILKHFAVELPLSGALRVDTRLTSVEPGTRLAVDAKAGDIAATFTSTQQDRTTSFEAAVPALDKVGKALQIEGLPAQDLKMDGRILKGAQETRLEGIVVRLGKSVLELDGTLGKAADTAEFAFKARGPSLAALSAGLPELPFTAAATATLAPEQVLVEDIKTTFGKSDLAGNLDVTMGEKNAVTGKFSSQRLDLTPFTAGGEAADAGEKPPQEAPDSKYVFVEAPLPFETLNKTDVDIDAQIGRLTVDRIVLLDVATAVDLKDGNLHFKNRFAGPEGGKSTNDISLTTAGKSAELAVNVNLRDLHLNLVSGDTKDKSLVPPIGVTLDFKSKGATPRALAASTNGRILLTAGTGQIENNLLATVSGDVFAKLFSALNPFSKEDPFTTNDCTILGLNITDGMADITSLYAQGEKVKVVGKGKIDLNTEAMNIEFNTKPRKGIGVSADMFVTPFVKLKGTLASPSIGLDKSGTLLAVGTGGLSVLAQAAADRIAGEKDSCAKMLEKTGGHPAIKD